jgi:hypothetical protein
MEPKNDQADGPQDELEPGPALRSELDRLGHHPREEAHRLVAEADEGEIGATPFITAATRVVPAVVLAFLVILALALSAYYLTK